MRINSTIAPRFHHCHEVIGVRAPAIVNITGIVVYARPGSCAPVREALSEIGGVEVHAVSPEGRMVVTVERSDDAAASEAFDAIAMIDGVLSTALVYHHDEALNEEANR
ncbi:Chaperone NapD [Burkholderiales bacterium]|nr:Chaperone NapD [Burkholderiales bacterium]